MQEIDLQCMYIRLNKEMFEDKLPNNIRVVWSKKMTKTAAQCKYSVDYKSGVAVRTPIEIKISTHYHNRYPNELLETMVHEMIHVKYPYDGHGKEFNREMDKLNKKFDIGVRVFATGRAVVNFIYTCKKCELKYEKAKKLKEYYNYRCTCGGELRQLTLD